SNNAAVTADGGEIGRAQALQARACGVEPLADMNPVLLKPQSETGAQVVVQGRVLRSSCGARDYHALKPSLLPRVLESFARLRAAADLVLVEGAGSPAEVNLREGDIANMGFARAAGGVPVVLAGDVERGGVIAQLVGTVSLLEPEERALLRGYVVNKFRGDAALFDGAHPLIEARTGLPSLGVVTWFEPARDLPKEDMLGLDELARAGGTAESQPVTVAVPRLPRLANLDDLDPLAAEPGVDLRVLEPGEALPSATDFVLLPGSKSTLGDLAALRREGWDVDILAHARRGGWVLGLCGGYQMLGRTIADPLGLEGAPGQAAGLGLLAVDTVLEPIKTLARCQARELATGEAVRGYEIHMGRTDGPGRERPMLRLGDATDGAVSPDGRVMGCYLHGLLAADGFRHALLARIRGRTRQGIAYEARVEAALDGLAAHLERCLDLDRLLALASR
ncbi:MAG TPA: cobyric acid synthase, partial [Geminicoccaceae bacterium]|nr:cobyric acid synthase [Geminicoccaceae bacterium]